MAFSVIHIVTIEIAVAAADRGIAAIALPCFTALFATFAALLASLAALAGFTAIAALLARIAAAITTVAAICAFLPVAGLRHGFGGEGSDRHRRRESAERADLHQFGQFHGANPSSVLPLHHLRLLSMSQHVTQRADP